MVFYSFSINVLWIYWEWVKKLSFMKNPTAYNIKIIQLNQWIKFKTQQNNKEYTKILKYEVMTQRRVIFLDAALNLDVGTRLL